MTTSLRTWLAGGRQELGMFAALAVMCLGLWASNPDFVGASNLMNTTRQVSMLGIFAIGIAFVIITGGIDLSIGSIIGLTGVMIARLSSHEPGCWGLSLWVGIPVALLIALSIGLAQGLLITSLNLQPFIVTLGGMLTIRGVSQTIVEGGSLSLGSSPLRQLVNTGLFRIEGVGVHYPLLSYPLLMFIGMVLVGAFFLHFTVFGRYVYAIGGNREAAKYSGIPVKRVETLTYVISAFTAGVAGICYASYIGEMNQGVGIAYELIAIAAAVLGGVSLRGGEGSVLGVIIGAAVMKVIDNGIIMFQIAYTDSQGIRRIKTLNDNHRFIIIGGVILLAVILDQVVHIVQDARRIRKAGAAAAAKPSGFEVIPSGKSPPGGAGPKAGA